MDDVSHKHIPIFPSKIEPHAHLLSIPTDGQLLYKIVTVENLLSSIGGNYLYFNRIDKYVDSPNADPHDGQQLPKDIQGNEQSRFEKSPDFSAANYYDQSRARTYACCFSLENSDFIWEKYGNGGEKGKVCIVFEFGKLRATINRLLQSENSALEYCGNRYSQIFSVNYGKITYVERDTDQTNKERLPNLIQYIYLKDRNGFCKEKELRISLSALDAGQFVLADKRAMHFPPNLHLDFDFRSALADCTIRQILCLPNTDSDFLKTELHKLHIELNCVGK